MKTYMVVLAVYSVILIMVGFIAKRKGDNTLKDFLVSNRDLGPLASAGTYYATAQSAAAFIGMAGLSYSFGWAPNNYISIPIIIGAVLSWGLLARPMRNFSEKMNALTVPELMSCKFASPYVRPVAAVIIIGAYLPMMVAQLRGGGLLLSSVIGIPITTGVLICALVITIYVSTGGFRAVAWTDVLQAIFMVGGATVLVIFCLVRVGGFTALNQAAAAIDPGYVEPWSVNNSWGPSSAFYTALLFGLAPIGNPLYIIRYFTLKDVNTARLAMPITYTMLLWCSFCFSVIGLTARVLIPGLAIADQALPELITHFFTPLVGSFFFIMIFSAMMSTVDSLLHLVGSCASRDLYQMTFAPKTSDKKVMQLSSVFIWLITALACVFAIRTVTPIQFLATTGTAFAAAAFVVPVLSITFWKHTTAEGMVASMIVGFVVVIFTWKGFIFDKWLLGVHPFVWGLVLSAMAMWWVSNGTNRKVEKSSV